jgi:hypothetical protein
MSQYPKAKYHATLPVACVNNPTEEAALGEGWYDYPHQVVEAKPEPKRGPGRPPKAISWADAAKILNNESPEK